MSLVAYTANLQHGQGTDGQFNFGRQITALSDADLIAVQERSGSETGWNSPMSNAGLAQAIYRANQIGGLDGCAIWYKPSKVTILDTFEKQLSVGAVSPWDGITTNVDKSAVGVLCEAEGRRFYFVSSHLCQNAGADANQSLFSAIREAQIETQIGWIETEMGDHDVASFGDLNLTPQFRIAPSGFQIDLFKNRGFVDLWEYGYQRNKAVANWGDRNGDGEPDQNLASPRTHDTRERIDWCLLKTVSNVLSLNRIDCPDWRAQCPHGLVNGACTPEVTQTWGTADDAGIRPTDHNPLRVEFAINNGRSAASRAAAGSRSQSSSRSVRA